MESTSNWAGKAVHVPADVKLCRTGSELVLLKMNGENFFSLDESSCRFWTIITTSASLSEAFSRLKVEFDVEPDRLEQDLLEFIDDLADHGLLEIVQKRD
jgi:hypothetical protein